MKNTLHLKAPGDWINDPNGFIYYKGEYHLFYQYFPGCAKWGRMHWGHAASKDLVSWRHLGIALYPSKPYDRSGCFSGSAIELSDGKMGIYYTGVVYLEEDEYNTNLCPNKCAKQSQAMLVSEDGYTFDNDKKIHIIKSFDNTTIGDPIEFRDPKVFYENSKYFMVTASTHEDEEGELLVHESEDGFNWKYKSRCASSKLGNILECPDLFKVSDNWILMCSPMNIVEGNVRPHQSFVGMVQFDTEDGQVKIENDLRILDYGMDLYAPQSTTDEKGRRVYIGWMRMEEAIGPESNMASNGRKWNGMMSLPRLVEVQDGEIITPVHPNILDYFSAGEKNIQTIDLAFGDENFDNLKEALVIETLIGDEDKLISVKKITLSLNEGERVLIDDFEIALLDGQICTDRTNRIPKEMPNYVNRLSRTPIVGKSCQLEVFVEPNLIEVFVNNGKYVISNIVY